MAGYSGKPLSAKLGIKATNRIFVENAPDNYRLLLGPLPEGVSFVARLYGRINLIHYFATRAESLRRRLDHYRQAIAEDGMIWVSWPKKAARVETDVTEDVIRQLALPLGLVDTKVCAVDQTWSGLKLVIRVANRSKRVAKPGRG